MASTNAVPILNEIGQILANQIKEPPDDILLYAEVEANMVAADIFELREKDILYREWSTTKLTYPLLDLWELDEPDRRWAAMEYVIRDGQFKVTFTYPDQFDADEDEFRRRDRVVWRNFGQLPIVYPPWQANEDEDFTLK